MRHIHYELGVRVRRRSERLWRTVLPGAIGTELAVIMLIGIAAFTSFALHTSMGPTADEIARRYNRSDSYSGWRLNVDQYRNYKTRLAYTNSTDVTQATTVNPALQPSVDSTDTTGLNSNVTDTTMNTNPDASDTTSQPVVQSSLPLPTGAGESAVNIAVTTAPQQATIVTPPPIQVALDDPARKDIAMQLVSSAENSSLDWKSQYKYLEDIGDGRGYTGGIIGFCSGTGDMLELVQYYTKLRPNNVLASFIPALQKVNYSASHAGLGSSFEAAWKIASADSLFQQAQNDERDRVYFNPSVTQAKADGLRALGQFIYYDAIVMHGPGNDSVSFGGIRDAAMKKAKTPAQGGDETTYLNAFLDARVAAMKTEDAHDDVSRVETAQRVFLRAGNFDLNTPLTWKTYGESYTIK